MALAVLGTSAVYGLTGSKGGKTGTVSPAPTSLPTKPPVTRPKNQKPKTTTPVTKPPISVGSAGRFAVASTTRLYTEPGQFIESPHAPNGAQSIPRTVSVNVYYPTRRGSSRPDRSAGPFPLIIFGAGYNEYPTAYLTLLDAWASAGYVVAAPVFPLTNPGTPGGPDEEDVINQPYDEQYVITNLLSESASGGAQLQGMINSSEIAVAGQSDGGNTALALGYDSGVGPNHGVPFKDPRIKAVLVLSGAQYPFWAGPWFGPASPPLLAVQGTADPINPPPDTNSYFAAAPAPKYLLCLQGANHLDPYTAPSPYEKLVAAVTLDFLDAELYNKTASLASMATVATTSGIANFAGACP